MSLFLLVYTSWCRTGLGRCPSVSHCHVPLQLGGGIREWFARRVRKTHWSAQRSQCRFVMVRVSPSHPYNAGRARTRMRGGCCKCMLRALELLEYLFRSNVIIHRAHKEMQGDDCRPRRRSWLRLPWLCWGGVVYCFCNGRITIVILVTAIGGLFSSARGSGARVPLLQQPWPHVA
jgi:hypothetical protein